MASRSILRAQVRTKSNTPVMCPHHKGNKAVLICLRPGCNAAFACVDCVATNHRGHELEKLETYAAEKKIALKDKVQVIQENVLISLKQKLETTKNKISSNKSQTKDEQQKIFKRCKALKEELDKIAAKCSESCEKTGEENDKKLTEHLERLESIYTKYKSQLDKCEDVIEEGSDSDIVIVERELPGTPDIPLFPDIGLSTFKFGNVTGQKLEDLFGEVTSKVVTKKIIPASPKVVDIDVLSQFELKGDTGLICGLLYPSKRKQLYIWFFNSNIVSIVTHEGKVTETITLQQSLEHGDRIEDMVVSPVDETLWSVSGKGIIQQIKLDGTKLQSIKYSVGKAKALCVTQSQEVVVGVMSPSQVTILTTAGKVTRTLKSNDIGLVSYPQSIIQFQRAGRLAVKDGHDVSVLDDKYNHLYTIHGDTVTSANGSSIATGYTSQNCFYPCRMCFDSDGNLLVVDFNSYSVVMFGPSGQYIKTIVKEADVNKRPVIVSVAPNKTLWVAYMGYVFRHFIGF